MEENKAVLEITNKYNKCVVKLQKLHFKVHQETSSKLELQNKLEHLEQRYKNLESNEPLIINDVIKDMDVIEKEELI